MNNLFILNDRNGRSCRLNDWFDLINMLIDNILLVYNILLDNIFLE